VRVDRPPASSTLGPGLAGPGYYSLSLVLTARLRVSINGNTELAGARPIVIQPSEIAKLA
jgi:hypothetical protein